MLRPFSDLAVENRIGYSPGKRKGIDHLRMHTPHCDGSRVRMKRNHVSSGEERQRVGVPAASTEAARRRMQSVRQSDTAAELSFCTALDRLGLHYTKNQRPLARRRRRADVLFESAKVAVFIDRCFWHSCPIHATSAKSNAAWWRAKLEANRTRDADTNRELQDAGWAVLRFWEHEAHDEVFCRAAACTVAALVSRRTPACDSRGRVGEL